MLRSGDALEEVTSASKEASHNDIYIFMVLTLIDTHQSDSYISKKRLNIKNKKGILERLFFEL
jgi:hypothetical protein